VGGMSVGVTNVRGRSVTDFTVDFSLIFFVSILLLFAPLHISLLFYFDRQEMNKSAATVCLLSFGVSGVYFFFLFFFSFWCSF
jgi:hypothetical protein